MIRRPPRSTRKESSAASDVYKRQEFNVPIGFGILTCYDLEQAKIRSDINQKNKGQEAALACIKLLK